MNYKFYDTCSLLLESEENLFSPEFQLVISSVTLSELESIKTSSHKDENVKYEARRLIRLLDKHENEYQVVNYDPNCHEKMITSLGIEVNNDSKIIACAASTQRWIWPTDSEDTFVFVTNDLCCKHIAKNDFNLAVESVKDRQDDYLGYKEVTLDEEEMSYFYTHLMENIYNSLPNEYLIIIDKNTNQPVDAYKWTDEGYAKVLYHNFKSIQFGDVKPMKDDIYQELACDSFANNKITMIKGPAGSGKTYLSLGYLFNKLENHSIDRIIIFCNTVATKNSARLGFYPGTRDEKLLDSQIGNLLSSKLGDRCELERLIDEKKIILLPLSDIRGYDTSNMRAGVYISEAQNMDISLMKLTLQRIGEDCVCIIDGDCKTQVDDINFAGNNNGMKRASKIFRGTEVYGEVTLKQIHRSRIAEIAELM